MPPVGLHHAGLDQLQAAEEAGYLLAAAPGHPGGRARPGPLGNGVRTGLEAMLDRIAMFVATSRTSGEADTQDAAIACRRLLPDP
jgi:hypothetical protein